MSERPVLTPEEIAALKPDIIVAEPSELIATGVSVSTLEELLANRTMAARNASVTAVFSRNASGWR